MESSRFRIRPHALLGAVLVLVAAVSGCGTGPVGQGAAATVDGHEISVGKVTRLLEAQTRYLESQRDAPGIDPAAVDQALANVSGVGVDTFAMAEATAALQTWINYQIVLADIEANGESVTDEDRQQARSQLASQVGGEEVLADLDEELIAFTIDSAAADLAINRVVAQLPVEDRDQRIQELFEQVAPTRPLCLSIIVSETEGDSLAALERVEAGEDFALVATEMSADPATAEAGGFSGCASVDRAGEFFGGDFSTVAEGDVVGPTELDDLFVLVHVDSTTGPTFEQIQVELDQQLAADDSNRAMEYRSELRLEADVSVDPRFGTWDPETGLLSPPAA